MKSPLDLKKLLDPRALKESVSGSERVVTTTPEGGSRAATQAPPITSYFGPVTKDEASDFVQSLLDEDSDKLRDQLERYCEGIILARIAEVRPVKKNLTLIRELNGDGFQFSVRDYIAGMMGNSSWCYGRFKTAAEARKVFGDSIRWDYGGCKHKNSKVHCRACKEAA